jgi:hypothetical protein
MAGGEPEGEKTINSRGNGMVVGEVRYLILEGETSFH